MINRLAMHQEWFDKNQNMMFLESRIVMQELLAMCRQYKAERDEAEPLLNELWDRRTDATEMRAEIERLRNDLDGSQLAYRGASYDRDRMRAERDEARRLNSGR